MGFPSVAGLQRQVEAARPNRLPHAFIPIESLEQLALEEMKQELLVRHRPQVGLIDCSKDCGVGDGIGREVLQLDDVACINLIEGDPSPWR